PPPEGQDVSSLAKVFEGAGHPDWIELNPQPLPPGPDPEGASPLAKMFDDVSQFVSHGGAHPDWIALNPQPLPPGPDPEAGIHMSDPINSVALNPQQLPPGPDPQPDLHLSDVLIGGQDPAVHAIVSDSNPQSMAQIHLTDLSPLQDYGIMSTPYEPPL